MCLPDDSLLKFSLVAFIPLRTLKWLAA
jgi:hypothetical protein